MNTSTAAATKNTTTDHQAGTEPGIIALIREKQKYTLMMLSVLHEQLAEFDIGKTPDYQLMLEIMGYMSNFPERFNYTVKADFVQKIIDNSPEGNIPLENLLAEQRQVTELAKEVTHALKALLKEQTILREEQLKIFSKNFVEMLESHIDIENRYILDNKLPLSDEELQYFSEKLTHSDDQPLAALVEERYKELSKRLSQSLDDWEEAASELAFAEFISMGALFDSIEPLSIGLGEVSQIIKNYSYWLYTENYKCYKELLTQKQDDPKAYIKQPVDCLLNSYREYVNSLNKIGKVLQKTRDQVAEPYEARKSFFSNHKAD